METEKEIWIKMNRKARLFISISLCISIAFMFLVVTSYAGPRKGGEEGKKKTAPTAPKFRYDESSKRYILDRVEFKAEFEPSTLTFIRKKKTGEGTPIKFVFEGFYQGKSKLFTGAEHELSPRLEEDGKMLIFDGKDYREVFESIVEGFFQVYAVKNVPSRDKDLVLRAKISTPLSLVPNGEKGFSVKDGNETISGFSQRVVIDKKSKLLSLKTVLIGNTLEITVPREYLSEAEFPIAIGPEQAFIRKELPDMPGKQLLKVQPAK